MWISSEDARSDFILAAAAVFLGVQVVRLLAALPGYPRGGVPFLVLSLIWLVLIALVPPWWLARHRGQVPDAFALGEADRGGLGTALVIASPLLVGYLLATLVTGNIGAMLLALAGRFTILTPTIEDVRLSFELLVIMVSVGVVAIGAALYGTFLAVRAREAFRSPDTDLTELLRTFGLGAVGLSFVMGLLTALRDSGSFLNVLVRTVALLAIVLLVDRQVPPRVTLPRAGVVGPAIAVLVLWIITFGGPFGGDLLLGLTIGTGAAAITIAAAALVNVKQGLAAAVLLVASALYPIGGYELQPLPLPLILG